MWAATAACATLIVCSAGVPGLWHRFVLWALPYWYWAALIAVFAKPTPPSAAKTTVIVIATIAAATSRGSRPGRLVGEVTKLLSVLRVHEFRSPRGIQLAVCLERGLSAGFGAEFRDLRAARVEGGRTRERGAARGAFGSGGDVVPHAPVLVVALERLAKSGARACRPPGDEL